MIRRGIILMCLKETELVGEKAKELDTLSSKLQYTGKVKLRNGVHIIVDKYWKNEVVDIKRLGYRMKSLKFVVEQDTFNVMNAYAPQRQLGLESTIRF